MYVLADQFFYSYVFAVIYQFWNFEIMFDINISASDFFLNYWGEGGGGEGVVLTFYILMLFMYSISYTG